MDVPFGKKEVPLEYKNNQFHIGNLILEPDQAKQVAAWILNQNAVGSNPQAAQYYANVKESLLIAIQAMQHLGQSMPQLNAQLQQPIVILQEVLRNS